MTRGTLYARAGLLDDAERELRALLAANPKSPTARKLLQSVRAIRRQ
ncbi:MAG: tetratricopeptide repeat protein [Pyrinomonadaceae bacterium]